MPASLAWQVGARQARTLAQVRLGSAGPLVPKLGFGGIPIQQVSAEQAVAVVRACFERGIRFYDTARGYTSSEEHIGQALAGLRDQVVLLTKSGARDLETLKSHWQQSLTALGVERVDVFLFHNVAQPEHLDAVLGGGLLDYMRGEQAAGRVGLIGISSHRAETAVSALQSGSFQVVEFPFNYLEDQALPDLLPLARRIGAGFIAMKPLAGGVLASPSAAIKWLMQQPDVLLIPGLLSLEQVEAAVAAALDPALTPEEEAAIERDRRELQGKFCRRCGYCMPCAQGVRIYDVISAELYFRRAGWGRADEHWLGTMEHALANCIQCGECESRCPYSLPVASLVKPRAEAMAARLREVLARRRALAGGGGGPTDTGA